MLKPGVRFGGSTWFLSVVKPPRLLGLSVCAAPAWTAFAVLLTAGCIAGFLQGLTFPSSSVQIVAYQIVCSGDLSFLSFGRFLFVTTAPIVTNAPHPMALQRGSTSHAAHAAQLSRQPGAIRKDREESTVGSVKSWEADSHLRPPERTAHLRCKCLLKRPSVPNLVPSLFRPWKWQGAL